MTQHYQHTPCLLTVRQFAEKHAAFNEGGLRYLIFNANTNGFQVCIRRMGRRVLLDEAEVFRWIDQQNNIQDNPASA